MGSLGHGAGTHRGLSALNATACLLVNLSQLIEFAAIVEYRPRRLELLPSN